MAGLIGKTLKNRYRVIDSLGRGGMAEVYRVWDEYRSVDIAMKVLRQDIAQDPIFLRRFKREAQSLAKLQHPSIVRFYGMEREGLLAFLLMEYIEGQSLQSEILLSENHPFSNQRILEILKPICSALNYAHKMGLAHCDLKPGNILIESGGRVLLTDFGIARTMDAATSTLVGAGTPAYMSPELIKGMDPTPQSDIYSLGIVLYEMLTGGERPFIGERATITGTTAEKVRWEHVHLNAAPVSRLNPGVDRRIDDVIAKCLAKDPHQRFTNALDIYAVLNTIFMEKKALHPKQIENARDIKQESDQEVESSRDESEKDKLIESDKKKVNKLPDDDVQISHNNDKSIKTKKTGVFILAGLALIILLFGINLAKNGTQSNGSGNEPKEQESLDSIAAIEKEALEIPLSSVDKHFSLIDFPGLVTSSQECKLIGTREFEDFIIQMTVTDSSSNGTEWDYGIVFRRNKGDDRYELSFSNSGNWHLIFNRKDGFHHTVVSDFSEAIHSSDGATNIIKLIAKGTKGYLLINNQFAGQLDLSDRQNYGEIQICAGLLGSVINSENTVYVDNVLIWVIPQ